MLLKIIKFLVALALVGALALSAAAAWVYFGLLPELPSIERLQDVRLQVPLRVYAKDGALLAEFGEKRRRPLAIEDTPDTLVNAFLAAEDDRFRDHPGVDYQGILRAAVTLATTGRKEQGGSTITMQVARNFFLTPEKTYIRKIKEILLALQIERRLSKDEILELYLNKIYLGNRAYGVAAAAQMYYGKSPEQLTLAESAMVAGLPKAPSRYNPLADSERALVRRNYVLDRMLTLGFVDAQAHARARAAPITAQRYLVQSEVEAQYVAEMVRAQMIDMFGEEESYTGGYKAYTTIAAPLQAVANAAVRNGLFSYEERHGYRRAAVKLVNPPPVAEGEEPATAVSVLSDELVAEARAKLATYPSYEPAEPALVTRVERASALLQNAAGEPRELTLEQLAWAKPRLDDQGTLGPAPESVHDVLAIGELVYLTPLSKGWRLVQLPEVEGALVALDPKTGAVRALVGGFSFERSKFNRAVQAFRQPGSNFKPFIYSAALENGFTAATLINDAPVVFDDPALEGVWRPENYSGKFYGPTRLREALIKSRNLVSVRVLISLGVGRALRYAQNFGFRPEQLPRDLSLVLGSGSVSPMQLARAYSVFANGGYLTTPYFIERIEDGEGNVVFTSQHLTVCPDCPAPVALPDATAGPAPGDGDAAQSTLQADGVDPEMDGVAAAGLDEPRIRPAPRVINPRNAFIMRTILRDVIRFGTGRRARVLKRNDLAGKTGTTNDQRDTWFSGFNSTLAATTWVGFDSQTPLGSQETGARAALPIWIDFMQVALDGVIEDKIDRPDGLVTALIDRKTGDVTSAENPERMFEIFREEFAPKTKPVLTAAPGSSNVPGSDTQQTSPEQLF